MWTLSCSYTPAFGEYRFNTWAVSYTYTLANDAHGLIPGQWVDTCIHCVVVKKYLFFSERIILPLNHTKLNKPKFTYN